MNRLLTSMKIFVPERTISKHSILLEHLKDESRFRYSLITLPIPPSEFLREDNELIVVQQLRFGIIGTQLK